MFSLIITIVAIALVAALMAVAYYFTSDVSAKYHVNAAATTLITQSQQIAAAGALATVDGVGWPAEAPHFTPPYLTAMPRPAPSAYTREAGEPSASDWQYYMLGPPELRTTRHFVLSERIRKDVCMEVNRKQGFIGIPATWDGVSIIQCYGTGDNANKGYTFLYDPPGTLAKDTADVVADTIVKAGPGATPGYPVLCPDGSTIPDKSGGVCAGGTPGGDSPGGDNPDEEPDETPAKTKGYWVFEAAVPANWEDPYIHSRGYSEACPAGGVNPAGAGAQPLVTNSSEPYNADGIMDMRWWQGPDGRWDPLGDTVVERVWCLPANPEDVQAGWSSPYADWSGSVKDAQLHPARDGVDPLGGGHYVGSTRATVQAGGVTWSMVAVLFEAVASDPSNSSYQPYIDGRKVAIGRGPQPSRTYYANVPSNPWYAEVQGSPYGPESGMVEFERIWPTELWTISPTSGPVAGGTTVTVSGAFFKDDDIVYFDGNKPAPVISRAPDTLVVTSPPAEKGGVVNVTVYSPSLGVTASRVRTFEYKEDPLQQNMCYYIGQSGPNMLFSRNGAPLLGNGTGSLVLTPNGNGEIPIRVRTHAPAGRGQEGFDKYLANIKGARIDGTPVTTRTTLVSASPDGQIDFDAWVPASAIPSNHVPTIELQTCGDYVPVSSFTGYRPIVIPVAADECRANLSRTPGQCTTTTLDYSNGDVIATVDWWIRGVYLTSNKYRTMELDTNILSTGGNCVPRAWKAWWWDDESKTYGSGVGWVECTALYSETRAAVGNFTGGTGSHSGIYVRNSAQISEFYARGATNVPYLNGRQNWTYGGENIYSFPFHTQGFTGSANCQWSGCVPSSFMTFGTVSEFNAYLSAVQSASPTQGGTSEQAMASYACVPAQYFVGSNSIKNSSDQEMSAQVTAKVQSSACYRMLNYNEVPPLN